MRSLNVVRAVRSGITSVVACALVAGVLSCHDPVSPSRAFPRTPAEAQFLTDDVNRFWSAYAQGGSAYQSVYLDQASAALKTFANSRSISAASLQQMVGAYPQYFAAINSWWRTVGTDDAVFATIRSNYARLGALLPEAFYPPVIFVVGRFSTGGTVNNDGIIIGTEFYGVDAQAPTRELNAFSLNNQKSWRNDLPLLVAHEHTHLLQIAAGTRSSNSGATLLARSLNEGGAEFVGSLASGAPSYFQFYTVWQTREKEFFAAFAAERSGTSVERWLTNRGGFTDTAMAPGPGYVGYCWG